MASPRSRLDKIGELRSQSREGEGRSEEVWKYLSAHTPLLKSLTPELLKTLGRMISDENETLIVGAANDGFRCRDVTMRYTSYTPPGFEKVRPLIDGLISREIKTVQHPLEAGIFLHLRIAGIQPFYDGNKRVARLLQNRLLYEHRLPPATIVPAERESIMSNF